MATLGAATVSASGDRGLAAGGVLQNAGLAGNGIVFSAGGSGLFSILENAGLVSSGTVSSLSRTGALAQTLAQLLLSAPNGVPIMGSAGPITLDACSLAGRSGGDDCFLVATGTVANSTGGGQLANLQYLLRGSAPATSSLNIPLDAATFAGTGVLSGFITGDLSVTLEDVRTTLSTINGTLGVTLHDVIAFSTPLGSGPGAFALGGSGGGKSIKVDELNIFKRIDKRLKQGWDLDKILEEARTDAPDIPEIEFSPEETAKSLAKDLRIREILEHSKDLEAIIQELKKELAGRPQAEFDDDEDDADILLLMSRVV